MNSAEPPTSGLQSQHPKNSALPNASKGLYYQLKILMLFLKRVLDTEYKFSLSTEWVAAEKFDDLVLEYTNDNNKQIFRFMQAKHTTNEDKITEEDLLTDTKKKLNLLKYFTSYRKITKNKEFNGENVELKDFTIYTNRDFDDDDDLINSFESVNVNDKDIFIDVISKGKRYKLKEEFDWKEKLEEELKRTSSNFQRLAEALADKVRMKKPLGLNDDLLKDYQGVLAKKIITIEEKDVPKNKKYYYAKFQEDFLNGNSTELKNFRDAFFEAYFRKNSKNEEEKIEFWEKMKEIELARSQNFGKFILKEKPTITNIKDFAKAIVTAIIQKHRIPQHFVKLNTKKSAIKNNINELAGYVLIEKDDKEKNNGKKGKDKYYYFSSAFLNNNKKLPGNLEDFRKELKAEFISKNIEYASDNPKFKIKGFHTCKEGQLHQTLPDDNFTKEELEKEIKDFLKKLVFAVDQPNEHELGNIIKGELGPKFKNPTREYVYYGFLVRMLDWLKEKEGRFISNVEGEKMFEQIKTELACLGLMSSVLLYEAGIKKSGCKFKDNETVNDFLKKGEENKQILILYYESALLSAMKVIQAHPDETVDYNIFLDLKTLSLLQGSTVDPITAFSSEEKGHVIVIEQNSELDLKAENLLKGLFEVLVQKSNKQLILITPQEQKAKTQQILINLIDDKNIKYMELEDNDNKFDDLTDDSQKKLKQKKIKFQDEEVTLDTLYPRSSNMFDDRELYYPINGKALSRLINNEEINIGSKVIQKSDSGSPAYNIISKEIQIERIINNEDDLFVISGINKEELTKITGITEEKICSFDDRGKAEKIILLINKDHDEYIKDFEKVCHDDPNKTIHFIQSKDSKFIWKRYYDPNYYIERKFYQIQIDTNKLREYITEDENKKDIFMVSGITKEDFNEKYKIDKRLSTDVNLDGNKPIIILNNEDKENTFSDLCKQLNPFDIHWIENIEIQNTDCLIWKCSKGTETSKLSNLISKTPEINDNDLINIVNNAKSTVIADSPGMGKSTTLTSLAKAYKDENKLNWVITVNLKDRRVIDNLPNEYNVKEIVKFFSTIDTEGLKDTFAKNLFEYRLNNKDNIEVLLLFDGFDEISTDQKEKDRQITALFKFLQDKTKARIVVTTRPYKKKSLEDALSVLSYTFEPIQKDKCKFLANFWKQSLKLMNRKELEGFKYVERAKNLIDKFDRATKSKEKEFRFMGIPLQLRMLAEIYLEKFKNRPQEFNDDFSTLNLFDFYKEFIDRKYKIYFSEKTELFSAGLTKNNFNRRLLEEKYEKIHKRLAFKYLFSQSAESTKLFFFAEEESDFMRNKMPNKKEILALNRIGITQSRSKDDIDFIHPTFAEYFVSKLIYERLQQKLKNPNYFQDSKDKMLEFLLNHIFIEEKNNVIRSFINCELQTANLTELWNGQQNKGFELLQEKIDPLKERNQLCIVAKEGLNNIFAFLLQSEQNKGIKKLISIPTKYVEKFYDDPKYFGKTLSFTEDALNILTEVLGEDHLEVALMQRYLGNAYGDSREHKGKIDLLIEALKTFNTHLEVSKGQDADLQKKFYAQALSKFEEFTSVKEEDVEKLDDNQKLVWKKVLKIEIAKIKRNLGNAYGELAEGMKKWFENQKKLITEALDIFEKYDDNINIKNKKLLIAKMKKNLGEVNGDLANETKSKEDEKKLLKEKERFLKEVLYIFKKLEFKNEQQQREIERDIAETKRNLDNAYGEFAEGMKKRFENKKKLLIEALDTFEEYKEYKDMLYIAKTKKNLGEVNGDLANETKSKEDEDKLLKEMEQFLKEALYIFNQLELTTKNEREIKRSIAETKNNLGDFYGKSNNHEKKKELLEEALPVLKKHYRLHHNKDKKAQKNLVEAFTALGLPRSGAVISGNIDNVEKELGREDNKVDDIVTLLHLAVREGHIDIVKYLINEKNAKLTDEDKYGRTSLHFAASEYCGLTVVRFILDKIKDKSKDRKKLLFGTRKSQITPLHYAVLNVHGNEEIVNILLQEMKTDEDNFEKLIGEKNNFSDNDLVKKLIIEKAAKTFIKIKMSTILHEAIKGGKIELIELVLKNIGEKNNINEKEEKGNTALILAAKSGKTKAAEILLEYEADPNIKNNNNKTALDLAIQEGHQRIVKALLDKAEVNEEHVRLAKQEGYVEIEEMLKQKLPEFQDTEDMEISDNF